MHLHNKSIMNRFALLNYFLLLIVTTDQTYGCSSACCSNTIPTSNCCQKTCHSSCTQSVCATSSPVIPTSNTTAPNHPTDSARVVPPVESSNPINVTSIVDFKNEIHNTNEIHIPINITNVNSNNVNSVGGRTQSPQPCNNGVANISNCNHSTPIPVPIPVPVPQDRPVPVPQPVPVPIPIKQPYPVPIPYTKYISFPQPYVPCESPCNKIHPIFSHPLSFPSKSWYAPGYFPYLPPFSVRF
ncbi:uncharacterized protein LOC108741052 [Agrilus planipennis]|uniref:Uncharacterized protein LOC108741052 n=1 Tax=Agrilus planipennis TaxID=224129 RepID=A0A1W4XFP2_AGRPL|nr:uncharacterized protein LOC108741052 [Agrilus planipennis]